MITAFFVIWMMFGGALFFDQTIIRYFLLMLVVLVPWSIWLFWRGERPMSLMMLVPLIAASLISTIANTDIYPQAIGYLMVSLAGLAVLVLASHYKEHIRSVLYQAFWIWLVGWFVLALVRWPDNKNITNFYVIVGGLLVVDHHRGCLGWLMASPFLLLPVIVRSRGALIGVVVALVVYFWPQIKVRLNRKIIFAAAVLGVMGIVGLMLWHPGNFFIRFSTWDLALNATLDHNPWLGLGPGGVAARKAIPNSSYNPLNLKPPTWKNFFTELVRWPYGSLPYFPHAHSFIVQFAAEAGILGLLALVVSGWIAWKNRAMFTGWQAAALAGIVVYLLADYPVYYPGPLFITCVLLGSLPNESGE